MERVAVKKVCIRREIPAYLPAPSAPALDSEATQQKTVDSTIYQFKRVLATKLARDHGVLREDHFSCN